MKILFINTYYYPDIIGGTEMSVKKLCEQLAILGHEVTVLTTGLEEKNEIINNVNIKRIKINNLYNPIENKTEPIYKKIIYKTLDVYNILNYNKLKKEVENVNPDIINVNNVYGISTIIYKIIKDLKKKCVVTLRDYYMLCPKVHMIRNEVDCENGTYLCQSYRNINKNLLKRVDCFTAPSQFVINKFIKTRFTEKEKTKVIYNAIEFDRDELNKIVKEKVSKKRDVIKYIYLGGLDEHKGVNILLKAFNSMKNNNIRLYVAGKGSLEKEVLEYEKNNNKIKYLGFLNENELASYLKECDVLIAPSIWNEPFGRVILDAYKYGLPVISSNKGGLDEIVDNYETGIKIKDVTEENLKNAIEYFIENDFSDFIYNCEKKIEEFGLETQAKEFVKLYNKVLHKK